MSLLVMLAVIGGYLFSEFLGGYGSLAFSMLVLFFLLYLPGYWISLIFFDIDEISSFERGVMSVMISCALIPFLYWYLDYFIGNDSVLLWGYSSTVSIIFASMLAVLWKINK